MTMHTQGPWEVRDENAGGGCNVHSATGSRVAHTMEVAKYARDGGVSADEAKANARLIAAAPELLEWAEKVLAAYMPQFNDSRAVDDVLVGLASAVAKAS